MPLDLQKNIDYIRQAGEWTPDLGAKLAELLQSHAIGISNVAQQTNADPEKQPEAPGSIDSVSVTAKDGIFDAKINDNSKNLSRGAEYFLEYSETQDFRAPQVVHVGASRNWRGNLGDRKLYFRAYSQYSTSAASRPVYHGTETDPTEVQGGGSAIGPDFHPSSGSGTSPNDGQIGASGYGNVPKRTG